GERVAERHGRGRAGRGRETEGAGLLRHAHVEDDVRAAREGRVEVAAEGDEREAQAARHRQEAQHLGALAGGRDGEQHGAAAARASGATNLRSPPDAVPSPPGCCTLCVASNTTGQPVAARIGSERRSATRLLYPNAKPRSVTSRSWLPVERAFSTTRSISPGERNCPFFRFTGFPAAATATMKSVCRQRKAGVCSTSTTAATAATCSFSCTSVSTASPVARRTSARMARPSSMPTPRKPSSEVRFALSKEDLYTTGSPARAAMSRTRSAWRRAASRDSMTHGPAISASGAPPPTVTVPTRTPRATRSPSG